MTLADIEATLKNLKVRHPELDEALLVTLLQAGGWEEKEIKEGVALFKSLPKDTVQAIALPTLQEAPSLPEQVDNEHLLVSGKENVVYEIPNVQEKVTEPQSLNKTSRLSNRDELPHDLPLRPFETSDNIWPFSRYKDVFYGDEEKAQASTSVVAPVFVPVQEKVVPVSAPEPKPQAPVFVREGSKVAPSPAREGQGEDRLVILACAMLIAVLFVLGYMYSNGRL